MLVVFENSAIARSKSKESKETLVKFSLQADPYEQLKETLASLVDKNAKLTNNIIYFEELTIKGMSHMEETMDQLSIKNAQITESLNIAEHTFEAHQQQCSEIQEENNSKIKRILISRLAQVTHIGIEQVLKK